MPTDAQSRTQTTLLRRLKLAPPDAEAWSQFVARYGPRIHRWCRGAGLGQLEAEELTQDVLFKLVFQMKNFVYDPTKSFRAWLKTVTRHALADAREKKQRYSKMLEDYAARLVEDLRPQFDQELMEEAMACVEERVERNTWEAFRLTRLENLSTAEAARELDVPEPWIRVFRGRVAKMIRDEYRRLDDPEEALSQERQ